MLVDRTLRPNPFQTYRDPETGRWVTVLPQPSRDHQGQPAPQPPEVSKQPQSLSQVPHSC
jgi:hypothetical protein